MWFPAHMHSNNCRARSMHHLGVIPSERSALIESNPKQKSALCCPFAESLPASEILMLITLRALICDLVSTSFPLHVSRNLCRGMETSDHTSFLHRCTPPASDVHTELTRCIKVGERDGGIDALAMWTICLHIG